MCLDIPVKRVITDAGVFGEIACKFKGIFCQVFARSDIHALHLVASGVLKEL